MRRRLTIGRTAGALLAVLRFSLTGSGLAVTWFAAYRKLRRELRDLPEKGFGRTVRKLQKDGLITTDGKGRIHLTAKGNRTAIARCLGIRKIPTPERWDGFWRVVSFDVPERDRVRRKALRECLREMGLVAVQQSVFAHKADCQKIVGDVAVALNLEKRIFFFETERVDGARDLERLFGQNS